MRWSVACLIGLAACQSVQTSKDAAFSPTYEGIRTDLLDGDLVNFNVTMRGARTEADLRAYAECAAAQYTLIRGYGFARHVRTTTKMQGGKWHADAVYTISPALPRGVSTIDAEVAVVNCKKLGIPTV